MSFHKITARMLDNRVEVETTDNRYAVFQHDGPEGNSTCPMDYLAGALGS